MKKENVKRRSSQFMMHFDRKLQKAWKIQMCLDSNPDLCNTGAGL